MPISVAFFMHDLSGGGVERMRLRLAAALAARGHAVTLIVQGASGALRNERPPGVALVDLDRRHSRDCVGPLAAWLRRHRPDILVSSLDHNNIAALCARALAGRATALVICQHNALSAEAALGWRYRVVPLLYRLLAPWADEIVAVSRGVADDLAAATGVPRAHMSVIHNPVAAELARDAPTPPHAWLADRAVPVFLFAGRLVRQKDPMLLLQAFALRLRTGAARLIVLGDGPLLADMRRACADLGLDQDVHFAGFVADPRAWMAHAAALVLSSRYEGFGNVIVEAMACGTPVIATDCPHGPGEILAGGRFGWLVPVGDAAALAAAMADDARASFPATRLMQRAQEFSIAACVARHEALFARVLRRRARTVFGLKFSRLDASGIVTRMIREPAAGAVRPVVTPNLDHVRLMRGRAEFAAACQAAAVVVPDGFPVALYARLRGAGGGARVTGNEIFHVLAARAAEHAKKILVVVESDATDTVLRQWVAARGLTACWTSLVAPVNLLDDATGQRVLAARIAGAAPDILVMTLGAPVSEIFVHRHRAILPPCWALCCGQAVRVELGLAWRAPMWAGRLNLEWAWRLAHEPRRLAPRYLRDAIAIPGLLLADFYGAASQSEGKEVLF
jgi:exopolysaccharide biosynthesis WecB/TagA/CpsF family protein